MNYYIQGNKGKADQIKAAFEKLGISIGGYDFSSKDALYFTYEAKGETYMMSTLLDTGLDHIILTHPDYKELELPVEPKFKVGDYIVWTEPKGKEPAEPVKIIKLINKDQSYLVDMGNGVGYVHYDMQDYYKLVQKPHYDIKNFKPYQKVLIRFGNNDTWRADFFSHIKEDRGRYFVGVGYANKQCIPFEGNEHLLGTTDMCDEQYINW